MFIREVILVVSNLEKSIEFYSLIFKDLPRKSGSRAEFNCGLVLCSEKEWHSETGLSGTPDYNLSHSSTLVFESDDFFPVVESILESGLMSHIVNVDNNSITLTDYDSNVLIIRSAGKEHATDDCYTSVGKCQTAWAFTSETIGKKGPFC